MSRIQELIKEKCPNGVGYKKLFELVDYVQPTKYIVKDTEYNNNYEIPVLTAGQTFILGYTQEKDGIYKASKESPVIIFDDFTTSNHWVDFNFKVKSSAIKILISKSSNNFRYIYYCIKNIKYFPKEHSRQWIQSFREFKIPFPPLEVQEEIVRILYAKYLKAYVSFNGMQRVDEYILPEAAAREIIYNFLQHKAYNVAIPTQIKVYEDYIYFWNPGEIPNEVKEILFKPHPSMPRNLKISQTFFRAGFVEYWGSGIKRITDACKEYGSPIPEIVNEAGGVAVKCKASDSYLKAMNGENNTKNVTTNVTINVTIKLTETEKKILQIITNNPNVTQKEIAEELNVTTMTVKRNIKKLKEKGIIDRVGANKNGYWKVL